MKAILKKFINLNYYISILHFLSIFYIPDSKLILVTAYINSLA